MQEFVVLVDQNDQQIGVEEKLSAHRQGLLHRAFSIFLFNPEGRMLIHQRALHKYHSGGLWTNACCSHPRPGEEVADAAKRRLQEELGISCALEKQFSFIYKVHLVEDGLYEHEFDHVFFGRFDGPIPFNQSEVAAVEWVDLETLTQDLAARPERYTYWFAVAFENVLKHAQAFTQRP